MRHKVKKIKFKAGKDAQKMILKKLVVNFLKKGQIVSTVKKIKILRSQIDHIVSQAKKKKIRELSKKINDMKLVSFLINKVVPVFEDRNSGFTTFKRIEVRLTDGSELAKLIWVKPIVTSRKKVKDNNETQDKKTNRSQPKK